MTASWPLDFRDNMDAIDDPTDRLGDRGERDADFDFGFRLIRDISRNLSCRRLATSGYSLRSYGALSCGFPTLCPIAKL